MSFTDFSMIQIIIRLRDGQIDYDEAIKLSKIAFKKLHKDDQEAIKKELKDALIGEFTELEDDRIKRVCKFLSDI